MSPEERDTARDARLSRLEAAVADSRTEIAKLREGQNHLSGEVQDLRDVVHRLGPLTTQMALNTRQLEELDKDMGSIRDEFRIRVDRLHNVIEGDRDDRRKIADAERKEAAALNERRESEKRKDFQWKVGLAVVVVLGVISSALGFATVVLG